jgi:DNA-binding transcriptional LysR family regulator
VGVEANDLALFAKVVEEGSFSRAGEALKLPKSTVSRRLAGLEAELGERLLLRTTRKLTVTDFGHTVLEHARQVSAEVEAATSLAHHRQVEPSGRLRVSMPSDFATGVLSKLLGDFIARYPAISLELDLSPRRVDLIGENFDLAMRMGELTDDATLAARRVANLSFGLYASPDYLRRRGTPRTPEDLMDHDALLIMSRQREPIGWRLTRGEASWEGTPRARSIANSPEMLARLAVQGAGIAGVIDHTAEAFVASGELMPVLVDWYLPPSPAWAVFPGRRLMPARTRVFLEALEQEFSAPRCQVAIEKAEKTRRDRIEKLQSPG